MVNGLVQRYRAWHDFGMRRALIACRPTETNEALARAGGQTASWELLTPGRALAELQPGDAALGRLDVVPTLDGMDDGLWALGALAAAAWSSSTTRPRCSRPTTSCLRPACSPAAACRIPGPRSFARGDRFPSSAGRWC